MAQRISNNARALLTSGIAAGDTSLSIEGAKADSFPVADTGTSSVGTAGKDWFKAVLQDAVGNIEIVYVRTRASGSGTVSNVLRGQEGTTARAFAAGSVFGLRLTATDYENALAVAANASADGKSLIQAANYAAMRTLLGAVGLSEVQAQTGRAYTTGGTSTAYTITPTPAIAAYAADLQFFLNFHVACGTSPTLSISGLASPPTLVREDATGAYVALASGEITAGHRSLVSLLSATQALVHDLPPAQLARKDTANVWAKAQIVTSQALTDGASIAVDASLGNNFKVTLGGNRALANPTNLADGQVINIRVKQDATGSRTLTYGSKYKWPSGVAPTLTTTASRVDLISGVYFADDDVILCNIVKDIR